MFQKAKPYVLSILLALGVGGLSALLTGQNQDLYSEIVTPPLAPPGWLFPVVWTVLYILMGISAAIIYTNNTDSSETRCEALFPYAVSLLVNFFWSILFFNMRVFLFSFIWLLLLLFLIVLTIVRYYKIKPLAAYLQIPYAVWVTFAGYLNLAIWILNK